EMCLRAHFAPRTQMKLRCDAISSSVSPHRTAGRPPPRTLRGCFFPNKNAPRREALCDAAATLACADQRDGVDELLVGSLPGLVFAGLPAAGDDDDHVLVWPDGTSVASTAFKATTPAGKSGRFEGGRGNGRAVALG